jgi:hypothetical protein
MGSFCQQAENLYSSSFSFGCRTCVLVSQSGVIGFTDGLTGLSGFGAGFGLSALPSPALLESLSVITASVKILDEGRHDFLRGQAVLVQFARCQ